MTRKQWAMVATAALVASVAGYWTVARLPSEEEMQVARAAKALGMDQAKLQAATDFVNRIQASNKLSASDREEVDRLLASPEPVLRRYGIKALQFGLVESDAAEIERVLAGMISDKDESVRATVAMTLYQVVPDHWERYEERLAADPSKHVKSVVRLVTAQKQTAKMGGGDGHGH